jgi:hypothetical protein
LQYAINVAAGVLDGHAELSSSKAASSKYDVQFMLKMIFRI